MIVVTGGAGFIGSNLVKGLNERGVGDILVVDDLSDGAKFKNIVDCEIADYFDKDDFLDAVRGRALPTMEAILHQGACSRTTEWDGRFMLKNNYEYSKALLNYALESRIPFLYASSAAVYGESSVFKEDPQYERPLNVYGYSKLLFDQYVRRAIPSAASQVVGFRYFNVYGPREQHKDSMASVAFHHNRQMCSDRAVKLFEGCDGYGDGEQRRDFIYVDDVVATNLWFLEGAGASGIYNLGTGRAQTFNDIGNSVIGWYGEGHIQYIPFPDRLKGAYQSYTQADLTKLRNAGFSGRFRSVEEGVVEYLSWLNGI